jgi:hypothetical protein
VNAHKIPIGKDPTAEALAPGALAASYRRLDILPLGTCALWYCEYDGLRFAHPLALAGIERGVEPAAYDGGEASSSEIIDWTFEDRTFPDGFIDGWSSGKPHPGLAVEFREVAAEGGYLEYSRYIAGVAAGRWARRRLGLPIYSPKPAHVAAGERTARPAAR